MIRRFLLFFILGMNLYSQETVIITEEIEEDSKTSQITEIYEDEIEALKSSSTGELVSNIPGIKLSKAGSESQGSWVSIRGSSPEQVLILLNGVRLNSSQGGGVNLNFIPVESIVKIEVIRGGGAAKYGGSAFGGVINIITRDGDSQFIKAGYSLSSLLKNRGHFIFRKNLVRGLSIDSSFTGTIDDGTFIENSNLKSFHGDIGIRYLLYSGDEIGINSNIYIDEKGVPGSVEFPSITASLADFNISSGMNYHGDYFLLNLNYLGKDREYRDPDYPLGEVYGVHQYKSFTGDIIDNFTPAKGYLSYSYDYLESSSYTEKSVDRSLISLKLSPEVRNSIFNLNTTARVDIIDFTKILPSWNIGLAGSLNKRVLLKTNIGSAYRLPGFDDLFWPETSFAKGNRDLKHENGTLWDLGGEFRLSDSLSLNLVGYYTWIEDLIVWNPGPGGVWSPGNLGYGEIYGIESEVSYLLMSNRFNGFIEGRLNYTFLSALNKSRGVSYNKRLINRAEHKSNLILIYRNYNEWLVTLDLSYIGDRYLTPINSKVAKGYLLVDISSTIPIKGDFSLSLYCKNLLNWRYEDYRGHPVPGIVLGGEISYRRDFYD